MFERINLSGNNTPIFLDAENHPDKDNVDEHSEDVLESNQQQQHKSSAGSPKVNTLTNEVKSSQPNVKVPEAEAAKPSIFPKAPSQPSAAPSSSSTEDPDPSKIYY